MKTLLLFGFSFFFLPAFSQNFQKDYKVLDSLTKNFVTYKVVLKNPYTTVPVNDKHNHLPSYFKFLKKKKLTSLNPDFLITILVDSVRFKKPEHISSRQQNESTIYTVKTDYLASFSMKLTTASGQSYSFPLVSNKYFTTTTEMPVSSGTTDSRTGRILTPGETNIDAAINDYALSYTFPRGFSNTLLLDVYGMLNKYRKGKKLK